MPQILWLTCLLFTTPLPSSVAISASEAMLKMSDGVSLYTVVLTPEPRTGKYPLVLIRTPYAARQVDLQQLCSQYAFWIRGGYAVALQHCRGCGRSEGAFTPDTEERQDGLDTLALLRQFPCYNGEIFLWGASYLSAVHYAYLDAAPSDVKGAVLAVQDTNRYNCIYHNGCFKIGIQGDWYAGMKQAKGPKSYARDAFRMLPLLNFSPTVFGEEDPHFDEPLKHPEPSDPFWETQEGSGVYLHAFDHLELPVLMITAFHDIYCDGMLRMWEKLPPETRAQCALVVTPYDHNFEYSRQPVRFTNGNLSEVCPEYARKWFDAIRLKHHLEFPPRGQVTWHPLFEDQWLSAPLLTAGPTALCYHLNAHSLDLEAQPAAERTYVYNPFAPASFQGGCANNFGGMQVQDKPDSRYDILSFVSAPFSQERRIQGPMEVSLHVKSDCPDTCFYVRFSLVHEGKAYGLRDDIDTLRRQHPAYCPGTPAVMQFRMPEHAFRLQPGDALRLDVSSSCWPYFVPHTNRAGLDCSQTGADVAHNTIYTGLSTLTLHAR